jgi:hypothetical protein
MMLSLTRVPSLAITPSDLKQHAERGIRRPVLSEWCAGTFCGGCGPKDVIILRKKES